MKGSMPRIFVPCGDYQFDTELMDGPFESLRPCVTFKDMGIEGEFVPFDEIMDKIELKLAELDKKGRFDRSNPGI